MTSRLGRGTQASGLIRVLAKVLLTVLGLSLACTTNTRTSGTQGLASGQVQQAPTGGYKVCPAGAVRLGPGDEPQSVLTSAGPGATVCFESGTYRVEAPIEPLFGQELIFRVGAVLNGSRIVTNWMPQGSYWVSTGNHQAFSSGVIGLPDAIMCGDNPAACIYEDVFLDGLPLLQVQSLPALDARNEVFFDKSTDTIYIAADPTDRLVEATVAGAAIQSSADEVTIRGAAIEKFAYNGISTSADDWTIEDSDIRLIHFEAIGIHGGTGHVIRNSRFHLCGIIGMSLADVSETTIQHNEFDHNNYLHAGPRAGGHHEGSIKIAQSRDVDFRANWSHDNVGDGLWFDWDNHDILIEHNLLENNSRNGLAYEASFDATVRYNTIRNNGTDWDSQGAGILNSTSKNVEYYGNRLEDNVIRSIVILWQDRGWSTTLGERQSANLFFHDNVIVLDANDQSWVGVYWEQDRRVLTSNNRFQDNTYRVRGDDDTWWLWGDSDLTWGEWRAIGFDTTGIYLQN